MPETSARAKRAVEKHGGAELLAAMVSLKHPNFMKAHTSSRDLAYNAIALFWEHNWTAESPIYRPQRAAWQEQLADDMETYVNTLQSAAVERLGGILVQGNLSYETGGNGMHSYASDHIDFINNTCANNNTVMDYGRLSVTQCGQSACSTIPSSPPKAGH